MDRRTILKGLAASPFLGMGSAKALVLPDGPLAAALASSGAPAVGGAVFTATETLVLGVLGERRAGSGDPGLAADPWHIGSNTKAMTAAVYQGLVEQGHIAEGATLAELFPDIAVDAALADLTADDLSGHVAGLRDAEVIGRPWLMTARQDTRSMPEQRAELTARVLGAPPAGEVGTFSYANINFIVQGAAIEQATGMAWEDVIRAELFDPLGMSSAGFGAPADPAPWGHRGAQGIAPGLNADNPPALGPAGTVHLNLADYGKWLQAILAGGSGRLSARTVEEMTEPPAEGETYRRGWGLIASRGWARGHVLVHEGSNTMWHAAVILAPVRGVALVTVSNSEPEGQQATQELMLTLRQTYVPD